MRVHGWQAHLEDEMRAAAGREFRWGSHDCCQFAARCYRAVTGVDMLQHFARYDDQAGALGIMWALGGMRGLLRYALGKEKPVAFAAAGDIVLIDMGAGEQPAVCMGLLSFAPHGNGLASRQTRLAIAAWSA